MVHRWADRVRDLLEVQRVRVPATSYVGRWPRTGVLTVTPDEVAFEPNAAEKRLHADVFSVPARDVRSVAVERRSARRPTTWGSYRVLCIEAQGREDPLRVGINHGRQVAPLVTAIVAGTADDRAVRRMERKVRQQFPTVSLWGQGVRDVAAYSGPARPGAAVGRRTARRRPNQPEHHDRARDERLSGRAHLQGCSAVVCVIVGREDPVHRDGAVFQYRAELLSVDSLGDGRAAVADQPRDVLQRHSGIGEQRDEAVA